MLRRPTDVVDLQTVSQPEFQQWIDDMIVTMRQANGVGLAAPQVGKSLRLTVIAAEADAQLTAPLVLINPKITLVSPEQESGEEGCLSIVGVFGLVARAQTVTVRAFDRQGELFTLTANGLLARVIQHEVDHLDGVLFIDRATEITQGKRLLA